ncbi:Asp23/Gls24 family envelope stress response protein [Georgenia sp. EYE_87]|uniref:Asp23/Gls24 family envelope stress response protein n=1 Tax=Georgenia sp. EYE_87 TaxID=2853448 RepID=UPI002006323F|nr:Asp23/Gls24 family envelope stress response protein [Georgenia sp. EYE_87]MCK6210710.1 Asp23/Gls24 family envelope stress response protein [Georgenia sp. EYE_87]
MAEDTAVLAGEPPHGRTTIADKVVEQLAARTALEVPGVVRHAPGPDVLSTFTSTLPQASAETAGEHLTISVRVAVDWGASAQKVAEDVRRHVRDTLQRSTGKTVDRVNVTVAALLTAGQRTQDEGRRVR